MRSDGTAKAVSTKFSLSDADVVSRTLANTNVAGSPTAFPPWPKNVLAPSPPSNRAPPDKWPSSTEAMPQMIEEIDDVLALLLREPAFA